MFIVPADDVGTVAAAATTPSIVREVPRMILLCTVRLVSHGITGGLDYCSWTLDVLDMHATPKQLACDCDAYRYRAEVRRRRRPRPTHKRGCAVAGNKFRSTPMRVFYREVPTTDNDFALNY